MTNAFLRAVEFADAAHQGQLDKAGDPYIFHALRVGASLLPDLRAAIAGVLHDVIEDTDVCEREMHHFLRDLVGEADALLIGVALFLLTRQPNMSYDAYIDRIASSAASPSGAYALLVKCADLRDNLLTDRLRRAAACGHNMAPLVVRYESALQSLERLACLRGIDH